MVHRARMTLVSALVLATSACTGATFGENGPGGGSGPDLGTYLELGSIAVDGTTENVFVLTRATDYETGVAADKRLMVAGLGDTKARELAELGEYTDLRVMFVESGVMVMGERGGFDELIVYDRAATREIDRASTSSRYYGTRISGGGEFVAVANGTEASSPIHVIRASDLSIHEIPHDGDWLEANWANQSDRLVAAVYYGSDVGGEPGQMRLMSWGIKSVADADFAKTDGFWANPLFDTRIQDVHLDLLFSFSWISVSPDDSVAAVPLVQRDEQGVDHHRLAVVTMATGAVRMVEDARGPVGFTPDGSTIVSYRNVVEDSGDIRPHLLMLDVESLEGELLEEPSPGLIQYFVTRDGNYVVVGDYFGSEELTLVDIDNHKTVKLGRPAALSEFVSRPGTGELYLVDRDQLLRLDLMAATLEDIGLSFAPRHVNRLPTSDQLVVDDRDDDRLVFVDPDDGSTIRSVALD